MADGTITFDVNLDDKSAQNRLKSLVRSMSKLQDSLNQGQTKREGLAAQYKDAQTEIENTKARIKDLRAQAMELNKVVNFDKSGGNVNADEWNAAKEQFREINAEIARQQKLLADQEKAAQKIEQADAKVLEKMQMQTQQLHTQQEEAAGLEKHLAASGSKGLAGLKGETEGAGAAASRATPNFKKMFMSILKYGLGIRSVFILIRKIRAALIEGVKQFAAADETTQDNINGLKSALSGLQASWGAAFAPVLNAVAPILRALIGLLTAAANAAAMLMAILGGGTSFKKAVTATGKINDNMGGGAGAAEDMKRTLMGIDEITKLDDDSGGGGGGGGGSGLEFVDEEIQQSGLTEFFEKIRDITIEWWNALDFTKLIAAWDRLKASVINLAKACEGPLLYAYEHIILPFIGWMMTEVTPAALNIIASAINVLAEVIRALTPYAIWLWENFLQPIANFAGDLFVAVLQEIADLLQKVADVISGNMTLGDFIKSLNGDEVILVAIAGGFLAVEAAIKLVHGALGVVTAVQNFGAALAGLLTPTGLVVAAIAAVIAIGVLLYQNWDTIKEAAVNTWNSIKNTIVDTVNSIRTTLSTWWDNLKSWWSGLSLPSFHIPLPHLSVEGTFSINPPSVPHFGINWYAKGGIVDGATLIGAGEKGPEAVIPLKDTAWMNVVADNIMERMAQSAFVEKLAQAFASVPIPAMASGYVAPPNAFSDMTMEIDRIITAFRDVSNSNTERVINAIDAKDTATYLDGADISRRLYSHNKRVQTAHGTALIKY